MSKESALTFLRTLGDNEKAKALLEQRKPANEEEKIEVYAEIATELGEPTTAEDFREAVKEAEERLRKKAEDAAAGITALKDEDVEEVAGGFYYVDEYDPDKGFILVYDTCVDDFTDTNCYFQDGCNHVICGYHDCNGTFHEDIRGKLEREHREIQKYRTACVLAP